MIKYINQINEYINNLSIWFCNLVLATMTILTIIQVTMRYVFTAPLTWVEELTRYQMVWLALIGSGIILRNNAHLRITFFLEKLPPKLLKVVSLLLLILASIFLLIVLIYGITMVKEGIRIQAASIGITMVLPYLAIPVGALIMLMHTLQKIIKKMKRA